MVTLEVCNMLSKYSYLTYFLLTPPNRDSRKYGAREIANVDLEEVI